MSGFELRIWGCREGKGLGVQDQMFGGFGLRILGRWVQDLGFRRVEDLLFESLLWPYVSLAGLEYRIWAFVGSACGVLGHI